MEKKGKKKLVIINLDELDISPDVKKILKSKDIGLKKTRLYGNQMKLSEEKSEELSTAKCWRNALCIVGVMYAMMLPLYYVVRNYVVLPYIAKQELSPQYGVENTTIDVKAKLRCFMDDGEISKKEYQELLKCVTYTMNYYVKTESLQNKQYITSQEYAYGMSKIKELKGIYEIKVKDLLTAAYLRQTSLSEQERLVSNEKYGMYPISKGTLQKLEAETNIETLLRILYQTRKESKQK